MKSFTDFMFLFFKNSNRGTDYIPIPINRKIFSLIITIFLLYTVHGKATDDPSNFELAVNKISYLNNFTPSSPHGFLTVSFTPGEEGKYLSVHAENNSENISGFIVENMFLPSIDEADSITEFSTTFFLSQVSVSLKLPITLKLTAYITNFPDFFPFQDDTIAEITTVDVTEIIYRLGEVQMEQIQVPDAPVIEQQQPVGDSLPIKVYRRDVDNVDLDSSGHPPTSTYAGDGGACAAASAANSMKWLEKTYPDIKLPKDFTLRKTLEELSGWMRRRNNGGPTDMGMIQGKLGFVDAFILPVEIKFQCEGIDEDIQGTLSKATNMKKAGEKPSWEFLKQMIQEGEDVEINYAWKDSTGKFDSVGHSVVVTGILEYSGGTKLMSYKHDTNQRCPGGLREEVHEISRDSSGWTRFGPNNEFYITCIIAESPDGSSRVTTPVELTSTTVPLRYELAQNYPNPFNPISNFEFRIADLGFVSLKVYDLLGNEISTLVNEEKPAGEYHITLDASNLSSGVYYYTLRVGSFVETKKMIVLK